MKRVLFIAKKGQAYSHNYGCTHTSSGLQNSAKFVVDMLRDHGVNAKLVQVVDNNDIDREVSKFRPDIAIIEALWVVPQKFKELSKLHPHVRWVVRVHSEVPFLAQEGIAVQWIKQYIRIPKVTVSFNSLRTLRDFAALTGETEKFSYLPNYFPVKPSMEKPLRCSWVVDVGCFGAIRPLKNQLIQAMAAIVYAERHDRTLRFHINSSRVEGGKEVLKNIRHLFVGTPHQLVEHKWLTHSFFQELLSNMDFSMCVSLSESFCIVAADSVSVGTSLICSPQVPWASRISHADPTDMGSIVRAMDRVAEHKSVARLFNRIGLNKYDRISTEVWLNYLS